MGEMSFGYSLLSIVLPTVSLNVDVNIPAITSINSKITISIALALTDMTDAVSHRNGIAVTCYSYWA